MEAAVQRAVESSTGSFSASRCSLCTCRHRLVFL